MKNVPYVKFNNIRKKLNLREFSALQSIDLNIPIPKILEEDKLLKSQTLAYNMRFGTDSITHTELEGLKPTLGYEIETIMGSIEPEDQATMNVRTDHDGSLRGPNGEDPTGAEYVTGVLYGDSGFKHLYDICRILNKNCSLDHRAGVHIHIGNLNWNKEDILYCYLLSKQIEKESFDLLPKSRSNSSYCRKLESLFSLTTIKELKNSSSSDKESYNIKVSEMFNELFKYVSDGYNIDRSINMSSNHPKGPKCQFNKASQRYCWMNFVHIIFNTRDNLYAKTLEIRSHSATLNYTKIKNWTKIWVAFTNFVTNKKSRILEGNVTLNEIVRFSYPKNGEKLIKYMEDRKKLFNSELQSESIDWVQEKMDSKTMKEVLNS